MQNALLLKQLIVSGHSARANGSSDDWDVAARIHWADSPWSVPRLRGRGEQGGIVMLRSHFARALLAKSVFSQVQERS